MPVWQGTVFSEVVQNKPFICLIWGIWTVPRKYIIFRRKKRQPFLHASWDHGNSQCQEFTTVSGNSACSNLKCWSVKGKVGHPGGCLCFMPVAPAHRIFVNAFRSGDNCPLCQDHKAHCGAAEREHCGANLTF